MVEKTKAALLQLLEGEHLEEYRRYAELLWDEQCLPSGEMLPYDELYDWILGLVVKDLLKAATNLAANLEDIQLDLLPESIGRAVVTIDDELSVGELTSEDAITQLDEFYRQLVDLVELIEWEIAQEAKSTPKWREEQSRLRREAENRLKHEDKVTKAQVRKERAEARKRKAEADRAQTAAEKERAAKTVERIEGAAESLTENKPPRRRQKS